MALATTFKINLIYKTPQGVDDTTADQIEDATGLISIADLMLNDLGGEAKEFYGIMQSEGAGEDPRLGSQTCLSAQGAALSVNTNGEIEYDPDGSATIQALAAGEWIEDSFVYVIRMADGTLSTATVTFIIHGVNDTPVVEAVTGDTAYWDFQETDAGLSKSGTLTVTDRDTTDAVNVSVSQVEVVAGDANGLTSAQLSSFFSLASTSLPADTGSVNNLGWTFDSGSEAFDHLAAGETLELKYSIQAQDDSGQLYDTGLGTVTIKITGTNDAPVITETSGASATDPILVAENTAGSFLTVTATDVDSSALTFSIGDNPDEGYDNQFFTIDPATGALSFIAPPDFEFTDPGNDDLYKVQVTVTDGQGGTALRDYFVQVTDVVEATPTITVDFNALGTTVVNGWTYYAASYQEDSFQFTATGNHTDAAQSLFFHDGGDNPGDNDIIITRTDGRAFSLMQIDVLGNYGGLTITGNDGQAVSFASGVVGTQSVNIQNVTSIVLETTAGVHLDNFDFLA